MRAFMIATIIMLVVILALLIKLTEAYVNLDIDIANLRRLMRDRAREEEQREKEWKARITEIEKILFRLDLHK